MNWAYTVLIFVVIIIVIIMISENNDVYYGYHKDSWANNIRVLGLMMAISMLLFGYACQIGEQFKPILGPLLVLTLLFFIMWIHSLICSSNFTISRITSLIIFILTLTVTIILSRTKAPLLALIALPFLAFSILSVSISYDISNCNPERVDPILY